MSDSISDRDILKSAASGHMYGDGANTELPKIDKFLATMHKVEFESHLPSVEIIKPSPENKIEDTREIPEQKITDTICQNWTDETPDTLTSSYMAAYQETDDGPKTIVTQTFESLTPPDGVEKVVYQFARQGKYQDDVEFKRTEVTRFEFRVLDPYKYMDGSVLETAGRADMPPPPMPEKFKKKLQLEDNQFLDTEADPPMIVTYYSVPIT